MKTCAALILTAILAASPAAAQQGSNAKSQSPPASKAPAKTEQKPAQAPAAGSENPNYVIGAQDVIDISVWKEPDVSRTVPVRPDGKISLPLLGDIQAAGVKPVELAAQITERLKKFFNDPQVTVIVLTINSLRFYITGEVNRAGAFPMLAETTVMQALASAGGFSQYANLKKIYVMRNEDGKQVKFPINYPDLLKGNHPEQNIVLKPGDTIVVP